MDRLTLALVAHMRAAGLRVIVIEGWLTRGRPGPFAPVGVLNHHGGASARGWTWVKELAYAKWMFLEGRADLPAPLCHIALGRSSTVYVGAAGRANHAGTARASGSVAAGDGNTLYDGIEWMLSGTEVIPDEMMETGAVLNAVLVEFHTKTSVETVSAHYQTSVTGKWDIGDPQGVMFNGSRVLDMDKFRRLVAVTRDRLFSKKPGPDEVTHINSHGPLARLGGEAGQALWDQWEASIRGVANEEVRNKITTLFTVDSNKRDGLPNFGPGLRRIGGKVIDLIAVRKAVGGASIKVLKRKMVNLHIDGHECYGVRLKVTFPSGKSRKYWYVMANLGRGVDADVFARSCKRIRKAYGRFAIYNFMEIDEADKPLEGEILRTVFPESDFRYVGGSRMSPTLVGRKAKINIERTSVRVASPGMAKVSPARVMVSTTVSPR